MGNSDTCQVSCNPKQIIPHPLHHFPRELNVPIEQRFHVPRVTLVPLEHVTCKGGTLYTEGLISQAYVYPHKQSLSP